MTPEQKPLTIKQQRAQQRNEKLAGLRREEKRRTRNKRIGIVVSVTAGVAVVGLLATSIISSLAQPERADVSIEGLQEFTGLTNNHVAGAVDYPQNPPVGGDHNQYWLNCAAYTEEVPKENAVHSLEHGAVWVTYDATALSDDELATLRSKLPNTYTILSPASDLPSPIVMSAWGAQLELTSPSDDRIQGFLDTFWRSPSVPEPGATCSGAIDGPGKDS